jgi:hypothetical protein
MTDKEQDIEGYDKEELEGGITVFKLHNISQETIEAWYQDVAAAFAQAIAEDRPARLLYDVQELAFPTPHLLQRAQDLADLPLPKDWRVATLTANEFARQIIHFIRSISLLAPEMYARSRVFSQKEEALDWLRS